VRIEVPAWIRGNDAWLRSTGSSCARSGFMGTSAAKVTPKANRRLVAPRHLIRGAPPRPRCTSRAPSWPRERRRPQAERRRASAPAAGRGTRRRRPRDTSVAAAASTRWGRSRAAPQRTRCRTRSTRGSEPPTAPRTYSPRRSCTGRALPGATTRAVARRRVVRPDRPHSAPSPAVPRARDGRTAQELARRTRGSRTPRCSRRRGGEWGRGRS
jgi:hypothetical protein